MVPTVVAPRTTVSNSASSTKSLCSTSPSTTLTHPSQLAPWIPNKTFESFLPKINVVVAYFISEHGVAKFGAMGYCMGAWIVAKYSATRGNVLLAGISFHPSWVFEHLFHGEGSGVKIAEQITVPQLILTAGNDVEWIKPGGDVDKILASRGVPSVLREFPDVLHGWVIRGDLSDPVIAEAYRGAWEDEALPFCKSSWLKC
ncbi:hypothetical protein Ae201684P_010390 [Aphanomyces euteiches]|nr:hypothetical protein Ae201684P_010390 [Aphanomyces euteiches]